MMNRLTLALASLLIAGVVAAFSWSSHKSTTVALSTPGISRDADVAPGDVAPGRHRTTTGTLYGNSSQLKLAEQPTSASARNLVLIVLDGATPDYFTVGGIPHLQSLMKSGAQFTNAFAGILESETPSGHATIGTGSSPKANGILSFAWANNDNTTVDLFDPAHIRDGQMERIIQDAPASSIAGLVHQQDPNAKVVALGGHKYYAQDAMAGPDANVIMYYTGTADGKFVPVAVPGHVPPASVLAAPNLRASKTNLPIGTEDHLAMNLAISSFHTMKQRVTLINMPEFDWPLGHVFGGTRDHAAVVKLMRGFDKDLGRLQEEYRKAGVLDKTLFVITADHGFSSVQHTISAGVVEKAVTDAGASILSESYHTAAYLWLRSHLHAREAAANLAKIRTPYIQAVYYKVRGAAGKYSYVRATGASRFRTSGMEKANQYLLNSFAGQAAPDLVVLFTEGTASLPGGEASWKGDHGGSGWNSQHLPILVSGPGVHAGYVSNKPAPLMDLAPTALALMGIPHPGMQGIALTDAMKSAPSNMRTASNTQARELQPVIDSLKRESLLEISASK